MVHIFFRWVRAITLRSPIHHDTNRPFQLLEQLGPRPFIRHQSALILPLDTRHRMKK
jgi:hypothetical protein